MIRFQDPTLLLLLILLPVLIYRYIHRERQKRGSIRFSSIGLLKRIRPSLTLRLRHSLIVFRCLALGLLILALARPQSGREGREILTDGIDIVLALDVSGSMDYKDLDPSKTRLQVSKEVVAQFVEGRANDRLGLVVFAGESYMQCPLTLDYGIFLGFLNETQLADETWDGTAIGTGIATAVNRLRSSVAKSKVVILLTDGVNNKGEIDPLTAANAAKALGIRIYTIGAGSEGTITQEIPGGFFGPRRVQVKVEIDEETLEKVADLTGGIYYRATSDEKLVEIYNEIGEMEQTEIKTRDYVNYTELFPAFLWPVLVLLGAEVLLGSTRFRRIP
ncbi:MAG TPA: aerotolerance regulator BatA [Candidatus Latescibacteria bacterium]|nr:aerotolerance regulator BatA [Candidatus Latescibacterota bacterium]